MATPDEAAATVAAFEEAYMQMLHRRLRLNLMPIGNRLMAELVDAGHDGRQHHVISTPSLKIENTAAALPAINISRG